MFISEITKKISNNLRIRSAIFLSGISYFNVVLGFITQAIIARILGSDAFGIVSLALAYPSLVFSVASPKSVSVITQRICVLRTSNKNSEIFFVFLIGCCFDLITSLGAVALILITNDFITVNLYKTPEISHLTNIYALSLPFFAITSTSVAVMNAYETYTGIGWLQLVNKIFLPLFFFLALPLIKSGSLSLIWSYAATNLLYGFLCLFLALSLLHKNNVIKRNSMIVAKQYLFQDEGKIMFRELTRQYGWNFALVTITGSMAQLPLMILGAFGEVRAAGFYRLASTIASATGYPRIALSRTILPKLSSESTTISWIDLNPYLKKLTLKIGVPVGLSVLLLCIPIYPIINLFYGSQFVESVLGIQILICGSAILSAFYWIEPLYFAYTRYKLFTYLHFVYFVFFIVLLFLFTLKFGFLGVCLSDLISKIFLIVILTKFAKYCISDSST